MHTLEYSNFLERFPEDKRIIFVGNAPSLKDERLGNWIDDHDVVVRFNESPINGFESNVGKRTDILISNPYPENRRPFTLSEHGVLIVIAPQTRRLPSPQFESWKGDTPMLFTFAPDIVQVGNIEHIAGLTTGTYGVHLITRLLKPSHVSITGFTMFLEDTSHHYWDNSTPKGVGSHDVLTEANVFISILNSFRGSMEVTNDIVWVSNRTNHSLDNRIKIKPLKNKKWTVK